MAGRYCACEWRVRRVGNLFGEIGEDWAAALLEKGKCRFENLMLKGRVVGFA